MSLNGGRHDAAWTEVWETYQERFFRAGIPLETFRSAVRESTYLFNEAKDEGDFADALFQMRELLEIRLMQYDAQEITKV